MGVTPHVVYHAAGMGDFREVVAEQAAHLVATGLGPALAAAGDAVRVSYCGELSLLGEVEAILAAAGLPVLVVWAADRLDSFETGGIAECDRLARVEGTDRPVLYLHTKGVSSPGDQTKVGWRRTMARAVVGDWRANADRVTAGGYDAAGWNWWRNPPHFSGNFWVASPAWLRRLPDFRRYAAASRHGRLACEFWVGSAPGCRAYSHGVTGARVWTGRFDFSPFLPRSDAAAEPGYTREGDNKHM